MTTVTTGFIAAGRDGALVVASSTPVRYGIGFGNRVLPWGTWHLYEVVGGAVASRPAR
jgi:hypothetical protein